MGQTEIAGIAIGCFVAGFVFRHVWPLVVAWQESRAWDVKYKPGSVNKRPGLTGVYRDNPMFAEPIPEKPNLKPNTPRRVGLAEARNRAEYESLKPVEHQAQVTANNIRAMEGK